MGVDLQIFLGDGLVIPYRILRVILKKNNLDLEDLVSFLNRDLKKLYTTGSVEIKKSPSSDMIKLPVLPESTSTEEKIIIKEISSEKSTEVSLEEETEDPPLFEWKDHYEIKCHAHDYGDLIRLISTEKMIEEYEKDEKIELCDMDYISHQVFIGIIKKKLFNEKVGFTPFYFMKFGLYITDNHKLRTGGCANSAVKLEDESKISGFVDAMRKVFLTYMPESDVDVLFGLQKPIYNWETMYKNFGYWIFSEYC